mmetsp:Transcript_15546/g.51014  ORF Transcript_15546/g.51014 Transcript_15546/m.51014 type:complete len:227 (+) Transcript_15546:989-1669(+)
MRIPVMLTHRSLWCLGPPRRPNRRRPRPRPRARQEQGSVRGVPGGDWRGGRRGRREHARRGVVDKHERELGRSVCGHVAQCKFQRHRPRAWIVVCFATSFERIRHDACGEVGGYQHHQRLVRGQDLGRMRLAIVRRGGSRAQKRDGAAGVFHQSVQGRHGVQARGDLGSLVFRRVTLGVFWRDANCKQTAAWGTKCVGTRGRGSARAKLAGVPVPARHRGFHGRCV